MGTQPPAPAQKGSAGPGSGIPDTREQLLESIAHLLSAGRSLSDVLQDAKNLVRRLPEPISDAKPEAKSTAIQLPPCSFDPGFPNETDIGQTQDPPTSGVIHQEERPPRSGRLLRPFASWPVLTGFVVLIAAAGTALLANLPVADAVSVVPTSTVKPAVKPAELSPATASAQPDRSLVPSMPKLSSEQAKMLLDRGDELMKRMDVSAGRLFYERAADAGNPEAALRLGATHDPAFLMRAGIQGVKGDPAIAARWYKRAHDLGATTEAEVLLKGVE